jgi:hypothetical protein
MRDDATYSTILGNAGEEGDWNLFELPQFNDESADCEFNEDEVRKYEDLKHNLSKLDADE